MIDPPPARHTLYSILPIANIVDNRQKIDSAVAVAVAENARD